MHTMSGPGTELGELIPAWIASQKKGCGCRDWARRMDRWGIDGCKRHRKSIIDRLLNQSATLPIALRVIPEAAKRIAAGLLVDQAITNAEKKEATSDKHNHD